MNICRRGFIRDASFFALAAAGAEMAGCASFGSSGAMSGFRADPMPKIRLGFMDLRWVYCLQNGLPLDMDVYDLAAWSAVVPTSAESDRRGGVQVAIPDFTRGAWRTAKPVPIGDVDLDKMGFDPKLADKVDKQLVV